MTSTQEYLARERQRELLDEAARWRLAREARRGSEVMHLRRRVRMAAALLRSAVRLRGRLV